MSLTSSIRWHLYATDSGTISCENEFKMGRVRKIKLKER